MSDDGTVSWSELATEATGRLAACGVDRPEHEATLICQQASGFDPTEWLTSGSELATVRGVAAFDRMLLRREKGEPLQYVLGAWGFRTLDVMVDHRTLIPRPETEQVAQAALDELATLRTVHPTPLTAADLGTGSGVIALSLLVESRVGELSMWATDVSEEVVAVARANLTGVGRKAAHMRIAVGSWFEALPDELAGELALVVSNPPYVAESDPLPAEVSDWEPRLALVPGPTGLEAIEHIVREAPRWLTTPGSLVVEIGETQGAAATELADTAGFATATVLCDLAGRDRILVARMS